jgi:hypothetical protein
MFKLATYIYAALQLQVSYWTQARDALEADEPDDAS